MVAIGLSLFLSALDATIVALALPPIASRFEVSDSLVAGVTLAYGVPVLFSFCLLGPSSAASAPSPCS